MLVEKYWIESDVSSTIEKKLLILCWKLKGSFILWQIFLTNWPWLWEGGNNFYNLKCTKYFLVDRDSKFIIKSVKEAYEAVESGDGYPYGALIVQNDEVIVSCHNMFLRNKEPTAHAEIIAIREVKNY